MVHVVEILSLMKDMDILTVNIMMTADLAFQGLRGTTQ